MSDWRDESPAFDGGWSHEFGDDVRVRADTIGSLRGLLYGMTTISNLLITNGEQSDSEGQAPFSRNLRSGLQYAVKHLAEAADAQIEGIEEWLREYGVKTGACTGPKENAPTAATDEA